MKGQIRHNQQLGLQHLHGTTPAQVYGSVMDKQAFQRMKPRIEQPDNMMTDKAESHHTNGDPVIAAQKCSHSLSSLALSSTGSPGQKSNTFKAGLTSEQEAYLKRIRALTTIFAQDYKAGRQREHSLEGDSRSQGPMPEADDRSKTPLRMPLRSTEPATLVQNPSPAARPVSPSFWTLSEHTTDESSIELPLKTSSPRKASKRLLPLVRPSAEPLTVTLSLGAVPSEISVTSPSLSSTSTVPLSRNVSGVPGDGDRSRTQPKLSPQKHSTGMKTRYKSRSHGELSMERRNDSRTMPDGDPPIREPGRWNLSGSQEDLAKFVLQGKKNERKNVENAVRRLDDVAIGSDQLAEMKALLMGGSRKVTDDEEESVVPPSLNRTTSLPPDSFTRWKAIAPLKRRERCTSGCSTTSNRSEDMSPMLQVAVAEHLRNTGNQRWLDSSSKRSNRSLKLPIHS